MNEIPTELKSAIDRIIELEGAIGMAIGALELINLSPYDFNKDGVVFVLKKLKKISCVDSDEDKEK